MVYVLFVVWLEFITFWLPSPQSIVIVPEGTVVTEKPVIVELISVNCQNPLKAGKINLFQT